MRCSRREVLLGAAAVSASLAGGSDDPTPVERTVTPVEVPRSDKDILREAAASDPPAIPSPVVVSDDHVTDALGRVEAALAALLERVDGGQEQPAGLSDETRQSIDANAGRARELLADAESAETPPEALSSAREARAEVGEASGWLRADSGDLRTSALEAAIETERAAARDLESRFEYRIAAPLAGWVPTYGAAERQREALGRHREQATEALEEVTDDVVPVSAAGRVTREIATHRHRRSDIVRLVESATAGGRPSLRTALESELDDRTGRLATLADRYEIERDDSPDTSSAAGRIEAVRLQVGNRAGGVRSASERDREAGRYARALSRAEAYLAQFGAVDEAVDETLELVRGGPIPVEAVPPEKQSAVERIGAVAEAPALGRRLARGCSRPLAAADRRVDRSPSSVAATTRAFFFYRISAGWAERARRRAGALAERLRAKQ
jgi:hypothetical protein